MSNLDFNMTNVNTDITTVPEDSTPTKEPALQSLETPLPTLSSAQVSPVHSSVVESSEPASDRSRPSSPKRVVKKDVNSAQGKLKSKSKSKGKGKGKSKLHCFFEDCSNTPLKFVGDCNFCGGHFCSKHRIMENHKCEGLKTCKEQMHKRNADKLSKEQTIVPRIQI